MENTKKDIPSESKVLLEVDHLKKYFPLQMNFLGKPGIILRAVDDISFTLDAGKTIGVVGESGCGKTTLGRTILKIYEATGGKTLYYGKKMDEFLPKYYLNGIKKLPTYKNKYLNYNSQLNDLEAELEATNEKITATDVSTISSKEDCQSILALCMNYKQKVIYEEQLTTLKENWEATSKELSQNQTEGGKALFEKKNKEYEKKVATLNQKLSDVENAIENHPNKLADSTTGAVESLENSASTLLDLYNQKETLSSKIANKKAQIEEILELASSTTGGMILAEEVVQFKNDLLCKIKLENKKVDLNKKIDALNSKISTLEGQDVSSYNEKITKYKESIEEIESELNEKVRWLVTAKEQVEKSELFTKLEANRNKGLDLVKLTPKEMRSLRVDIQLIFQDPYSSLPPRMTVGSIISEAVRVHHIVPKKEIHDYVLGVMKKCGLQPQYYDRYPHEFSGGQRQRICIARALAVNPRLVICDEPVSALDVSIQAQIINLLKELQKNMGLTYVFISHDLSVVKYITDQIMVMYLGNLMEIGDTKDIFANPLHPYTEALFSAVPVPNPDSKMNRIILQGDIPSPANPPKGCKFHTRCPKCMGICKFLEPKFIKKSDNHYVSCHLYDEEVMAHKEELEAEFEANTSKENEGK